MLYNTLQLVFVFLLPFEVVLYYSFDESCSSNNIEFSECFNDGYIDFKEGFEGELCLNNFPCEMKANNCPSGMTCADNVCEKCANMDDEYCIPFEVTEGPPDKFANSTNKLAIIPPKTNTIVYVGVSLGIMVFLILIVAMIFLHIRYDTYRSNKRIRRLKKKPNSVLGSEPNFYIRNINGRNIQRTALPTPPIKELSEMDDMGIYEEIPIDKPLEIDTYLELT